MTWEQYLVIAISLGVLVLCVYGNFRSRRKR